MIPHWLLIVVFMGKGVAPSLPGATMEAWFANRDLCQAAEAKLVSDLGDRILSHQCALAALGEAK